MLEPVDGLPWTYRSVIAWGKIPIWFQMSAVTSVRQFASGTAITVVGGLDVEIDAPTDAVLRAWFAYQRGEVMPQAAKEA